MVEVRRQSITHTETVDDEAVVVQNALRERVTAAMISKASLVVVVVVAVVMGVMVVVMVVSIAMATRTTFLARPRQTSSRIN
jgi:hypothetical protein